MKEGNNTLQLRYNNLARDVKLKEFEVQARQQDLRILADALARGQRKMSAQM